MEKAQKCDKYRSHFDFSFDQKLDDEDDSLVDNVNDLSFSGPDKDFIIDGEQLTTTDLNSKDQKIIKNGMIQSYTCPNIFKLDFQSSNELFEKSYEISLSSLSFDNKQAKNENIEQQSGGKAIRRISSRNLNIGIQSEVQPPMDQTRIEIKKPKIPKYLDKSNQFQRVCRICYAGEPKKQKKSKVIQNLFLTDTNSSSQEQSETFESNILTKNEKLLKQICKCKGSMNYVHESCLVKWLTTRTVASANRCELCLQEYKISFEYDSLPNNIYKGLNYIQKDKRRLLRGFLYSLYLWIFLKRFLRMFSGSMNFAKKFCQVPQKAEQIVQKIGKQGQVAIETSKISSSSDFPQILFQKSHQINKQTKIQQIPLKISQKRASEQIKKLLGFQSVAKSAISMVCLFYKVFIFLQMSIILYGESMRIKKYLNQLVNNSKKIRIHQLNEIEDQSQKQ